MFNRTLKDEVLHSRAVLALRDQSIKSLEETIAHLAAENERLQGEIRALNTEKDRFVTFFDRLVVWRQNQAYCFGELYDMIEAVDENAFKDDL